MILELSQMYDCESIAIITTAETAFLDNVWLPVFYSREDDFSKIVLNGETDLSMELREHERICVVSYSEVALKNAAFEFRQRRPVKILMTSDVLASNVSIEDWSTNDELDFDTPPYLKVKQRISNIYNVQVLCPDMPDQVLQLDMMHSNGQWIKLQQTDGNSLLCVPNLNNKTLVVSAIGIQPYLIYNADGSIGGTEMELLKILANRLNFDMELIVSNIFIYLPPTLLFFPGLLVYS